MFLFLQFNLPPVVLHVRRTGDDGCLDLTVDDNRFLFHVLYHILAEFAERRVTFRTLKFFQEEISEEAMVLFLIRIGSLVVRSGAEGNQIASGRTLLFGFQ